MRFLLRPGWLALIVTVVAFVVACYALLAPWQFGREDQRVGAQQAIDTATATAPVPYGELTPIRPDVEWRQVTVTGTYLPEAETVVRLRVVDGKPAVEVLTPLRTDDGRLVLVDRGTVEAQSGATVPEIDAPPAGPVTITARLRVDEVDPENRPVFEADGHRQLYHASSATVAAATGLALDPGYLLLAPGQPGVLAAVVVAPPSGVAPFTNFSYALQWLTFGAIALFALVYFVRLEMLQRQDRKPSKATIRQALAGDDPHVDRTSEP